MKFKLQRTDGNRSLKAWTAAEEHSLNFLEESYDRNLKILIMNENYGFYNCYLYFFHFFTVLQLQIPYTGPGLLGLYM